MAECGDCGTRLRKRDAHNDPRYPDLTEEYLCTDCCKSALETLIEELQEQLATLGTKRKSA